MGEGVDVVLGCALVSRIPGAGAVGAPDAILALDGDPAPRLRAGLPRREALGPLVHAAARRLVDSIPVRTVTVYCAVGQTSRHIVYDGRRNEVLSTLHCTSKK